MLLNAPPLMLYCTVNPFTGATKGSEKLLIQVVAGMLMAGAAGNTTALTALLCAHAAGAVVPCAMVPQADARTYLERIV